LPDEALQQADQMASELHVSRAEFFRQAVAAYANALRKKKEEEAIYRQREEACRGIDEIREKYGSSGDKSWDSTKIIREWRDKDRLDRMNGRQEAEQLQAREKDEKA
jgi:Fe-S-cluster containining protein